MKILKALLFVTLFFSALWHAEAEEARDSLESAITPGQCETVRGLLKAGMSPNTTFVDYMSQKNAPVIFSAVSIGNVCIVEVLLVYGADRNAVFRVDNYFGRNAPLEHTPLSLAIQNSIRLASMGEKYLDVVKLLLRKDATVDVAGRDGVSLIKRTFDREETYLIADEQNGTRTTPNRRAFRETMELVEKRKRP